MEMFQNVYVFYNGANFEINSCHDDIVNVFIGICKYVYIHLVFHN